MKINRLDFIFGLVVILVAGSYIFMAMQIPESLLSDTVGAGGLPRMLGWAMMGLGALVRGCGRFRRRISRLYHRAVVLMLAL